MKMRLRMIPLLLSLVLVLGMMPAGVFAEESADTTDTAAVSDMLDGAEYAEDQIVVVFNDSVSDKKIESIAERNDTKVDVISDAVEGQKACQLTVDKDASIEEAMGSLMDEKKVEYVQPNYRYSLDADDPYMKEESGANYQYMFESTNALKAWDLLAGKVSEPTVVAVIDTGADIDHEDLQKNLLKDKYAAFQTGEVIRDMADDAGEHGTHCTGIIGATYGNGKGGSGIASGYDNDLVKVMTVCTSPDGMGLYSIDVYNAMGYVLNDGKAKIVSMSFGFDGRDRLFADCMAEAYNKGVTLIAASGNEDYDGFSSPEALPEVISVNASNSDRKATYWSNYGRYSDISAPGNAIMSTVPGDLYAPMSGTSMATPCAAGIAALVLDANPDLTNAQVRNILCATTFETQENEGFKFDNGLAYGNVDAEAAVQAALDASSSIPVESMDIKAGETKIPANTETGVQAVTYPATALTEVTFTSSDDSVAEVDNMGTVIGKAAGKATITATAGGVSRSVEIEVTDSVSPTKIVIDRGTVGDEISLWEAGVISAKVEPDDAVNNEIIYESSDPSIAFIGETGVIEPKKTGTVTITCSNYTREYSESFELTVKNGAEEIDITKGANSVALGKTAKYTGKLTTTEKGEIANDRITWKTSYRNKATIDENGVLTPKKIGKVYVIAEYSNPNLEQEYNSVNIIRNKKQVVIYDKEYSGKAYNLRQTAKTKKSITLKWKKIEGADGYIIYQSATKNGKYKKVKTINKASTVKAKINVKKNKYYKVRAFYNMDSGAKKFFNFKDSNKVIAKVKK